MKKLVWIGADGSVQLCDVAFPLGNVNERRLRDYPRIFVAVFVIAGS